MPDNSQQHFYQSSWFILIILIIGIGIIGNMVSYSGNVQTDKVEVTASPFYKQLEKEELQEKMAQKQKTPEAIAAEIIIKNFGSTSLDKEKAVVSSRFENGVVETIALEEKFKSAESLQRSILHSTVEFMEAMKSQEDVTQATLIVQAPLTDHYGNVENGDVMIVLISKETLRRINFHHFNAKNLSAVADSYWEHPAFSVE